MERPSWAPADVDLDRPSVARVYDYYLGGSHNFEADRAFGRAGRWSSCRPCAADQQATARSCAGPCAMLAAQGISQFLDLGSGIPTFGNVHEVAQAATPAPGSSTSTTTRWRSRTARRSWPDVPGTARRRRRPAQAPAESSPRPQVRRLIDLDPAGRAAARRRAALRAGRGRPVRTSWPSCATRSRPAAYSCSPTPRTTACRCRRAGRGAVDVYQHIRNPLIMRSRDEIARFFERY